jgi:hypothetical protein
MPPLARRPWDANIAAHEDEPLSLFRPATVR